MKEGDEDIWIRNLKTYFEVWRLKMNTQTQEEDLAREEKKWEKVKKMVLDTEQ